MATFNLLRRILPALLVVACLAPPAAGSVARGPAQQTDRVVQAEGLRLVRHADDTYELSADGAGLEALVGYLADLSGAEFSVDPELLAVAVTVETERIALGPLLEQLRASLAANLIVAGKDGQRVSRVWLTPTTVATAAVAAAPAGAPGAPATMPTMPGTTPPPGNMPVPTGSETRAAGYDPGIDMSEYIRNQAAATKAAAQADPTTGTAGQSGEGEDPAATAPPIPMDPSALETYFAGDTTTKTYHRLNCIQAMYLPSVNKVWFKSRQEAIAAGYTPHEVCIGR